MRQTEIDGLKADLADVDGLLGRMSEEDDPIGHSQFVAHNFALLKVKRILSSMPRRSPAHEAGLSIRRSRRQFWTRMEFYSGWFQHRSVLSGTAPMAKSLSAQCKVISRKLTSNHCFKITRCLGPCMRVSPCARCPGGVLCPDSRIPWFQSFRPPNQGIREWARMLRGARLFSSVPDNKLQYERNH